MSGPAEERGLISRGRGGTERERMVLWCGGALITALMAGMLILMILFLE